MTITAKSPELYQIGENTGKNIEAKVNLNVNYDKNFDKYASVTGTGTNYYATGVSTTGASTNLSYTAASLPSDHYDHYTTGKLSVTKGGTFTMTVTQNSKWSKTLVYFDWDGNGGWETATTAEEGFLFGMENAGTDNGDATLSNTITVPTDVVEGTKTRMRVVTVDAWSSHTKASPPRNEIGNSSTVDFDVEIIDNTAPVFSSELTVYVSENSTGTAYTATATDNVSVWTNITFSLAASASTNDNGLFNITSTGGNGLVTFRTSPDYESPQGINKNNANKAIANTYKVQLIATDQANNSVTEDILIKVTDLDEIAPNITSSATASTPENKTDFAYTITANEEATFTLGTAGGDEALFKLAANKVSFKAMPDYEAPKDKDKNNTYKLELKATDAAGNTGTKLLSITVTDVAEQGTIALPEALAFADTKVSGTLVKDLTIKNTSNDAVLNVTAITYPAGFTSDWTGGGEIAAGAEKVVKVTFKPTEAKDYNGTVTVTSDGSGRNTLTVSGQGILVTAIEPGNIFPGLSIFPNPAEDVLNIKLPNQTLPVSVQLVDVNGQVVYQQEAVTGNELSIDVSGYRSGVYVLVVESGSKVTKRKVMIR